MIYDVIVIPRRSEFFFFLRKLCLHVVGLESKSSRAPLFSLTNFCRHYYCNVVHCGHRFVRSSHIDTISKTYIAIVVVLKS